MTPYINIHSLVVVPIAMIVGDIVGHAIAVLNHLPEGTGQLFGNAGALAFAIYALKWMAGQRDILQKRMDDREKVIDEREILRSKERDEHIKTIAEIAIQNQAVIGQNSQTLTQNQAILADTKFAIEKCMKCEVKLLASNTAPPKS